MSETWPAGSVTGLIGGPLLTPVTSAVLRRRLDPVGAPDRPVLNRGQLGVLAAVAARLVPQDRDPPIDLAAALHRRLGDGTGDGWRYADLPPDAEAVARGLTALDATARAGGAAGFAALDAAAQDEMLSNVQIGWAGTSAWAGIPPARWFEELLTSLVDLYYSHPLAQEEIGFAGMADARGWQDTGFAARAPHEPEPDGDPA